jgi:sugar phosphate isomerase/epimerase
MSGLPAAEPGGTRPSWTVIPWDSVYKDTLDYQWDEVAIPFWTGIEALAAENDVRVAIEMHPHNLVFNPATMQRLAERTGGTHLGAEMDPSHLFWQHIDPVRAVEELGELVFFAAAKDTLIHETAAVNGVLDDRFERIPEEEHPLGLGGRHTVTRWPSVPGWSFVAVGRGHDVEFWSRFLTALGEHTAVPAVNIEHEDASLGQVEGLRQAAETLVAAAEESGLR